MFLKNKNIIFKIRRSNVTDYAALITYGPILKSYTVLGVVDKIFIIYYPFVHK